MGKRMILIEKCATRFKGWLHGKLENLSPKTRIRLVLVMFVLFAALCLYMTVTAFMEFGRDKGREETMEIRHIERLDLPIQEMYNLYIKEHGNKKRTEE